MQNMCHLNVRKLKVNTLFMYFFSFQLWSVFSTKNRMKNRPLIIIEPQAHKKLNPSLLTPQIIRNPHRPSLFRSNLHNFDQLVNDISGEGSIHTCHWIMLQGIPSELAADENMTDN